MMGTVSRRSSTLEADSAHEAGRLRRIPDVVVRVSVAASLWIMPLAMGGRHVSGRLLFLVLVAIGLTFDTLRLGKSGVPRYRVSPVPMCLLAAALVLALIQIVPLPSSWVWQLSPALRSWFGEAMTHQWPPVAHWNRLSLAPSDSQNVLTLLVAYGGWCWLVMRELQVGTSPRRLIGWVGFGALSLAVLALAQLVFNNGRFLWWYDHPSRTTWYVAKGPFANENHLAHALLIGGWALVWWLAEATRNATRASELGLGRSKARRIAWRPFLGLLAIGTLSGALVLTRSRAGIALLVLSSSWMLVRCAWLSWGVRNRWRDHVTRVAKRRLAWPAIGVVGLGVLTAGMAFRAGTFEIEAARLLGEERWQLWQADWQLLPRAGWLGTGGGTHRYLYRQAFSGPLDVEFVYAENGYLQIALEYGWAGFAVLIVGLACLIGTSRGWWRTSTVPGEDRRSLFCPSELATLVLMLVLLHGAVDFVWWIPACAAPVLAVWLAASSQPLDGQHRAVRTSMSGWGRTVATTLISAGLAIGAVWGVWQTRPAARAAGDWERYLRLERDLEADELARPEWLERRIELLERVVRVDRGNVRAAAWLAELYLARFDMEKDQRANAMSLADFRSAARGFPDRRLVRGWFARAVGDGARWVWRAEALYERAWTSHLVEQRLYRVAAQLAFLRGGDLRREDWLWQTALRLAPRDAELLFLSGNERAQRGELARAWVYWRRAAGESEGIERLLQRTWIPQIGIDVYLHFMRPSAEQLRRLYRFCRRERRRDAPVVAREFVTRVRREFAQHPQAIRDAWLSDVSDAARLADAWEDALWIEQVRLHRHPNDEAARRKLAEAALKLGRWSDADRAIEWLERFGTRRQVAVALRRVWYAERAQACAPASRTLTQKTAQGEGH